MPGTLQGFLARGSNPDLTRWQKHFYFVDESSLVPAPTKCASFFCGLVLTLMTVCS
jgi:hypothetical protein